VMHIYVSHIAVEEETKLSVWLYHQSNKSIYVTVGVLVMSLPARLLQKRDHELCMPNRVKPKIIAYCLY
jgi:hypothetical protein